MNARQNAIVRKSGNLCVKKEHGTTCNLRQQRNEQHDNTNTTNPVCQATPQQKTVGNSLYTLLSLYQLLVIT